MIYKNLEFWISRSETNYDPAFWSYRVTPPMLFFKVSRFWQTPTSLRVDLSLQPATTNNKRTSAN